jgi:hypothetical protein
VSLRIWGTVSMRVEEERRKVQAQLTTLLPDQRGGSDGAGSGAARRETPLASRLGLSEAREADTGLQKRLSRCLEAA